MSDKQQHSRQTPDNAAALRKRAEEQARNMEPTALSAHTPEEIQRVFHELRVHQIELEMQNEELRTAQARIEAGRERYFDLFDLAPVGYCTVSEKGLILETNLTAATMLCVTRSTLVKQQISRFILRDDEDIYYLHRKFLFDTGEPQECELRLVKQDGTLFWAHLTETATQAEDGTPLCRVVISDITARKQAEAEREKFQAQLIQAQKMESVGRLAGGVAHDFNNMLGVILGHTELALEQVPFDHPIHADLEEIQEAAQRSANLTRQLLAFARKQTVAPRVLNLNDTIDSMLKLLRRLIGEDIDLAWRPGKDVWPVKLDPTQIDQILANLCVNARDAIAGVGKIIIETENVTFDKDYCTCHAGFIPGDYVLLVVSDDGCGMSAETLSHLFEPFFTTKELGKGTGLGLASIYGAVKQNNGFVNVYSELGQGMTFRIYLPRHPANAALETEERHPLAAEHGSETILLVEDEPTILKMTTMMLERLGYTVIATGIPSDAVRLAEEYSGHINLLMTDVVMPGMNGLDLAKNLLSIYPNIRRLFMSGYTANVIAHHGVLDEGVHFIQKPFSMKDLGAKIREALENG